MFPSCSLHLLRAAITVGDSNQYSTPGGATAGLLAGYESASSSSGGQKHTALGRSRPSTPDIWPLTRLSDGLSITSGLAGVIVAW